MSNKEDIANCSWCEGKIPSCPVCHGTGKHDHEFTEVHMMGIRFKKCYCGKYIIGKEVNG